MWLVETDRPISIIAVDAGFSNLTNFNRRFLAARDMTPKEFRRSYLKHGHVPDWEEVDLTKRSPSLETAKRQKVRATISCKAFKELAQDGRGIKRATQILSEFLCCLAARIRALCAFKELAQNGRGIKRATQMLSEFLCCLAARIRALCAFRGSKTSRIAGPADPGERASQSHQSLQATQDVLDANLNEPSLVLRVACRLPLHPGTWRPHNEH